MFIAVLVAINLQCYFQFVNITSEDSHSCCGQSWFSKSSQLSIGRGCIEGTALCTGLLFLLRPIFVFSIKEIIKKEIKPKTISLNILKEKFEMTSTKNFL